jgi:hypothetical protein
MSMGDEEKKWFFNENTMEPLYMGLRKHPDNGGWYGGKEWITDKVYDSPIDCLNGQIDHYENLADEIKKQKFKYM